MRSVATDQVSRYCPIRSGREFYWKIGGQRSKRVMARRNRFKNLSEYHGRYPVRSIDQMLEEDLSELRNEIGEQLPTGRSGVVAVGIARRHSIRGVWPYLVIKVAASQFDEFCKKGGISRSINGVCVRIEESDPVHAVGVLRAIRRWHRSRFGFAVQPGMPIGLQGNGGFGTLGFFATTTEGAVVGVTCQHVLADRNGAIAPGSLVVQRKWNDQDLTRTQSVGEVMRGRYFDDPPYDVDAATVLIGNEVSIDTRVFRIGRINPIPVPASDAFKRQILVQKTGGSTVRTRGRVMGLFITRVGDLERNRSGVAEVLEVRLPESREGRYSHLCWSGDSGSVFWSIERRPRPVAQLVSNDLRGVVGLAQPIETVLNRLGLSILGDVPTDD